MDDEIVRKLIREEFEELIKEHSWPDKAVQEVLLEVAKDHLWKQGLWVRMKYWTNVIGFLGLTGAALAFIASLFGYELIQR